MCTTRLSLLLASWLATTPVLAVAQAPCTFAYAPGEALAGVDGYVTALAPWDPDGAGPAPLHVVAAGAFQIAGDVLSPKVAAYEPAARQWIAIGQGLPGLVRAVAARPNGNLLAASNAGGVFEWNGVAWQQLGGTFSGPVGASVTAVTVMQNGDVVAGGVFATISGAQIHGIARWNGTTWQAMGAPARQLLRRRQLLDHPWPAGQSARALRRPELDAHRVDGDRSGSLRGRPPERGSRAGR